LTPALVHHHLPPPSRSTLFPYTTLFRSDEVVLGLAKVGGHGVERERELADLVVRAHRQRWQRRLARELASGTGERVQWQGHAAGDRKSTRLNSSHVSISYAVFCLKKKI